jgi:outer membrane protein OmpA-like peptidoglycan-associated protein
VPAAAPAGITHFLRIGRFACRTKVMDITVARLISGDSAPIGALYWRPTHRTEMTMMIRHKYLSRTLAVAFLASGLAMASAHRSAKAEELSTQQIVDGLKVRKTRGLSMPSQQPAMDPDDLAFVKRVRGQTRSLSFDDREKLAAIAPKRPKIDLEINFEYNSAALTPAAEPQLNSLGKALTSAELTGSVIMLGGHTDAKGGEDYNQKLSERRAEAVKRFLIENYRIPAANLVSAGYGKKGLKNTADPYAAENRRVEIVNMAEKEQASQ